MVDITASTRNRSRFSLPFDASAARRQLHLSLGLVTVLAIGLVSASVAVGGHPLAVKQDVVARRAPAMQAITKVTGAKPI